MVALSADLCYTYNMIELVDIQKTLLRQKALLKRLENASEKGPEGQLRYRRYPNGTAVPYLIGGSRKARFRKRLDSEDKIALKVLQDKTLALQAIPLLKEHIAMLEAAQGYEDFNLYSLCRFLGPEFLESADGFLGRVNSRVPNPAFDNMKDRQNPYPFDPYRKVVTDLGEFRSKSESLDAEFIVDTGCRFKYEPALPLGSKTIYPDFAADRVWRMDVGYIEHLGLIDKPDYREKKLQDIRDMADHGIYPGIHLLIISESRKDGFDAAMAKRLIRAFCMP